MTLHPAAGAEDPADRVTLDETVSFALMRMLETLSPAERTAFVLHDVFGLTHERRGIPVHGALVKVNGEAGRLLQAGSERSVLAFSIAAGRIVALDVQRNPAKLERTPWLG